MSDESKEVKVYDGGDMSLAFKRITDELVKLQVERYQLYGTLAMIMTKFGLQDIQFTWDEYKKLAGNKWVQFLEDRGEDGSFGMKLHLVVEEKQEVVEEE